MHIPMGLLKKISGTWLWYALFIVSISWCQNVCYYSFYILWETQVRSARIRRWLFLFTILTDSCLFSFSFFFCCKKSVQMIVYSLCFFQVVVPPNLLISLIWKLKTKMKIKNPQIWVNVGLTVMEIMLVIRFELEPCHLEQN